MNFIFVHIKVRFDAAKVETTKPRHLPFIQQITK